MSEKSCEGKKLEQVNNFNNTGTLVSSANYGSANGNNGSYLNLEAIGGNDYLIVEDEDDLDFDKENIGISFWIYPKLLNDVHFIINKGDQYVSPKTTNYSVRISKSNNIEFLIRDQNDQAQKVASTFTVTVDAWQFVAVYYDFSNKVVHFWNSNTIDPIESIAFETEPIANNDPLAIGSWYKSVPQNSSVKDFEGWIDEVRISGRQEDLFPNQLGIRDENGSKENALFAIYPNPINEFVIIENSGPSIILSLQFFDRLGRLVLEVESNPSLVNVSRLNTGLFLLKVETNEGTLTRNLIKE